MANRSTQHELVWTLHHKGWTIPEIASETGFVPDFIKREIVYRWSIEDGMPDGVLYGTDNHEDRRNGTD